MADSDEPRPLKDITNPLPNPNSTCFHNLPLPFARRKIVLSPTNIVYAHWRPAFLHARPITAIERPSVSSTMSDYIQNQEYSMQLAAPGDDPFEYDRARLQEEVNQAMPSLFADTTPASLQEDIDADAGKWSALNDSLKNGPWRNVFRRPTGNQGAEAQPDS